MNKHWVTNALWLVIKLIFIYIKKDYFPICGEKIQCCICKDKLTDIFHSLMKLSIRYIVNQLSPTARCNMHRIYCIYRLHGRYRAWRGTEKPFWIITDIHPHGVDSINGNLLMIWNKHIARKAIQFPISRLIMRYRTLLSQGRTLYDHRFTFPRIIPHIDYMSLGHL